MKVLLDHNLDRRLKFHLEPFECATTFEMGWSELTNGELLTAAEGTGFDVLLTADANIPKQQNIEGRKISIVIIRALNNRRATHLEMIEETISTIASVGEGAIVEVFHPKMK